MNRNLPSSQSLGPEAAPAPVYLVDHEDDISDAFDKIAEAIAVTEMAWRIDLDNAEDAEMLQNAARATFRLLENAQSHLAQVRAALAATGGDS